MPAAAEVRLFENTPLILVDTREKLEMAAAKLGAAKAIGVDTESDSFHHYQEKVCLLQFSDLEQDYIVDPLALKMDLSALAPVFADPNVCKIFHGADYDIVCLKRDFKFEIRNVFDTMVSSQQLGTGGVGLADLVLGNYGIELDKKYQRHDWAERPLRPEHIEYARGDTHWLISLREVLVRRLERANRLHRVLEECRILEDREWEGRSFDPDGYLRVKTNGVQLDDKGKRILRRLYLYRDEQARRLDRPSFKVIPDPVLVEVAQARPTTDDQLERLFPRAKSAMKRRHAEGFLEAVNLGLEDDFPIPRMKAKKTDRVAANAGPARLTGRSAERAMNALKEWRNQLVSRTPNLNPVAVVSNNTLKSIIRARPETLEELTAVPDVRAWQVEAYGAQMLEVLDRAVPKGTPLDDGDGESEGSDEEGGGRSKRRRRRRRPQGASA